MQCMPLSRWMSARWTAFSNFFGSLKSTLLIVLVQPVAFAIVLEDGAVDPAVAVEIGELGLLVFGVEVAHVAQKFGIAPVAFERGGFGIAQQRDGGVLGLPVFGLRRVHAVAIGLVVPPHVAEILGRVGSAGVNVADHALAGGNRARQAVLDGVAFLVLLDGGVGGGAVAQVAARGIGTGVRGVAIVGVDHVAGGATGAAIVAGLIVGAEKVEQRVEQAGALQALEYGVGARQGAEAAIAQAVVAALEDAQRVAGLGGFELRQRPEFREPRFELDLGGGGRRNGGELLRRAIARIAFSEERALEREGAVVVERRSPEERAVAHQAGANLGDDRAVAVSVAAGLVGDAQVAGVEEADELGRFPIERGVTARRVGGRSPEGPIARRDVGGEFVGSVGVRRRGNRCR